MAAEVWKQFERNPITHSAAHHLLAIAQLREAVGYARVSDVARDLNITRGSVSLTLKTLKQRGLVEEDENRFLRLSEAGEVLAHSVRGKKYLFQTFLHRVLGVAEDTADEDTCKIEHLVSHESAERLARFLRFVHSDDEQAQAFLEAWRRFSDPGEHDPAHCPACQSDCMVSMCGGAGRSGTALGWDDQS